MKESVHAKHATATTTAYDEGFTVGGTSKTEYMTLPLRKCHDTTTSRINPQKRITRGHWI
jgi:hypothetical protein